VLLGGTLALFISPINSNQEPKMLNDPSLQDLIQETIEEYYKEEYNYGLDYDEMPEDLEGECPEWIKEQLDDDIPF